MKNRFLPGALHPDRTETKRRPRSFLLILMTLIVGCSMILCSCKEDGQPIAKPDEYTHVYQAKEKHILRAIYQTFRDKEFGRPAIDEEKREVTSDYVIQGEWRVRGLAKIRDVGRNEREVALSIVTEKRTPAGWELRRLLDKAQHEQIFDAIDTQIYREMSRPE